METTAASVLPERETSIEQTQARLTELRSLYQLGGDLSAREVARLRFIRWLYLTGRLAP